MSRSVHSQFRVLIVQPGVQRNETTVDQHDLLGSTEQYLTTLRGIKFVPITS